MSARITEAMVDRLRRDIDRLREEATLDDNASRSSNNPDAAPMFSSWAAAKRQRADDIESLLAAISTEPGEAQEWQPIETAPFDKLVDLWCIQGYEREATWPVRGSLVGGRHKTKDYGWFGNQSKDGVPQKDAPDLVPVAWRPVNVPADLVARFLCSAGRTALEDKHG